MRHNAHMLGFPIKMLVAGGVAVMLAVGSYAVVQTQSNPSVSGNMTACTDEAKICPDGSAVGRTGPDCQFAACPGTSGAPATSIPQRSGIAIGESATVNGTTITVLGLLEDSRCPADVQCIWAGQVRVRAAVDAYNRDFIFVLGTPQTVGDATITLTKVVPAEKESTATIAKSDYRFTFTVTSALHATIPPEPTPEPVYCTMDAMQCPDGSYVGRTGPNCEFHCPGAQAQ